MKENLPPYLPNAALFSSSAKRDSLTFPLIRLSVLADNLKEREFPVVETSLLCVLEHCEGMSSSSDIIPSILFINLIILPSKYQPDMSELYIALIVACV